MSATARLAITDNTKRFVQESKFSFRSNNCKFQVPFDNCELSMSISNILRHFSNCNSTSFKFVAMETKLKTIYKHQFSPARRCIFFTYWFTICIAKLRENLQFKYLVPRNYDIFIAQPNITELWNIYSIYFPSWKHLLRFIENHPRSLKSNLMTLSHIHNCRNCFSPEYISCDKANPEELL